MRTRAPLFFALPRLRGRCQRLTLTEGVMAHRRAFPAPAVADYRATSPEDGGGRAFEASHG
jgi:hypothetical protein